MAEPFKTFFNVARVTVMAEHLARHCPDLDKAAFIADASGNFDALELKERSNAIRDALISHLPDDFTGAVRILTGALAPLHNGGMGDDGFGPGSDGVHGWLIQPMADYIAARGLDDFDTSMPALAEMTKRFTSEFAVRPFIAKDTALAMTWFARWAEDANMHVRRLASEGCRPRLPWGMRLHAFVADPAPILPILERLRDDPEEYVRRSVANNLNDIAKDHPDLVASIAKRWMAKADKNRQRLVRHACRSLVKAGHQGALEALGYGPADVRLDRLVVKTPDVVFGTAMVFEATIVSLSDKTQPLVIDYVIHHVKADGGTTPKVFKLKVGDLGPGDEMRISKKHAIRQITTRVYYPGRHRIEMQVNGQVLGGADFALVMPPE